MKTIYQFKINNFLNYYKKNVILMRDKVSSEFHLTFRNFVRETPDLSLRIFIHENSNGCTSKYPFMYKIYMTLECEHREISSLYSHVLTKISLTHQNMMLTINFLHYKQQVPGQLRSPQSNDRKYDNMLPGQGYSKSCGRDIWVWSTNGMLIIMGKRRNSKRKLIQCHLLHH
jgi:hypothetical protein